MSNTDLIWLSGDQNPIAPNWSCGAVIISAPTPSSVARLISTQIPTTLAEFVLIWDADLGIPDETLIKNLIAHPIDVWHAGLRLGQGGKPGIIDFFAPTWPLNRDPESTIEATSWRLSLRACLIRMDVLRQLDAPDPAFMTLDAAALDLGYRWIKSGAIIRHRPDLIAREIAPEPIPLEDELRFLRRNAARSWQLWSTGRAILSRYASILRFVLAWTKVRSAGAHKQPSPYQRGPLNLATADRAARVTALIPTLDRYSYLRTLLVQIRSQTIPPMEILIIDQTETVNRDLKLADDFPDLPIKHVLLDKAGQCSSRNLGLQMAQGEYILFLDDDVEIRERFIETHLASLARFANESCSGPVEEVGAGQVPRSDRALRISDVFPACNTMIRREALQRSRLFDLAYEHMQRADGDLGMRVYLSGATMILDPDTLLLHHHAPRGGLRAHRARVTTYASSRRSMVQRHLPSVSELYLGMRYFSDRQQREANWIRVLGTFSVRGGIGRKLLKLGFSLILLPNTLWRIRKAQQKARAMLKIYPQIPTLD